MQSTQLILKPFGWDHQSLQHLKKASVNGDHSGVRGHGQGERKAKQKNDFCMIPNSSALVPASSESCRELWVPAPAKPQTKAYTSEV